MHQIRFRLGLHPRPHWGSSQHSPDPLVGFKGSYFEGKGSERRERGRGEEREGREREVKGEGGRLHHGLGGWIPWLVNP